jgi:uncharacterized protein YggU (UPF0235/DUF167 family)
VVPDRLSVPVRVIPRSRTDRVGGMRAGRLVLRVAAAPESGAANRAATALLATALGIRTADVRMETGGISRDKTFSIPATARAALVAITTAAGATATPDQSRDTTRGPDRGWRPLK